MKQDVKWKFWQRHYSVIDARYQVGWETDHPWDRAHFQKFMTKNLLDDSNTPGME